MDEETLTSYVESSKVVDYSVIYQVALICCAFLILALISGLVVFFLLKKKRERKMNEDRNDKEYNSMTELERMEFKKNCINPAEQPKAVIGNREPYDVNGGRNMGMEEKYPFALPPGTILAGQYIIDYVLGQGGFGITYKATDYKTGQKVAVKEFYPEALATRTRTTVIAFSGEKGENFAYGKSSFLQEAETLAEFIGNENIVKIHSYFEENNTAYFVMDFVEGISFDQYIKEHGGRVSYEEAKRILHPVMDALMAVHSKGIVHRDVTPDNIYITGDGTVKLLDFGAARYSLGDKSRSLDVVLKHGFAPKEQYTRHGKQGPFTDVYTLGASFYFAITGRRPPDSIDRLEEDDLIPPSSLGVVIPPTEEDAILRAMSVQTSERFQTMGAFKQALLAGDVDGNVV